MFIANQFPARTLQWWYHERDNIDFNPPYQRKGGIWTTKDKAYLIDTILNGYDMPKFYLADFTYPNTALNQENKSFAVIDGKQRFEAIFDFFEGKLLLDKTFKLDTNRELKLGGLGYKDLVKNHPRIASSFDVFNISVMSVVTNEEGKINDLFVRLNRSKPLAGSEVRNAMKGTVPTIIRRIAAHRFFEQCVAFGTTRRQEDNAAAKLLLVEFRGRFVDLKRTQMDKLVDEGVRAETSQGFERAEASVQATLDSMVAIFTVRDPLLKNQGVVPLYYVFCRDTPSEHHGKVREFLVNFEQKRTENRRRALDSEKSGQQSDQEWANYEFLSRNPNDQGSLTARLDVLQRSFEQFVAPAKESAVQPDAGHATS